MNERRNDLEIVIGTRELLRRSQTRIDLLFTMSEIPHARPEGQRMRSDVFADDVFGDRHGQPVFALSSFAGHASIAMPGCATLAEGEALVEPDGIEPTTSCLQSTRSPS